MPDQQYADALTAYHALPTPSRASYFCQAYREKLRRSLLSLILTAEKSLRVSFGVLRNRIGTLDPRQKISPTFFHLHGLLRDAMLAQDVLTTRRTLDKLSKLDERQLHIPARNVVSARIDDWELPTIEELEASNVTNARGDTTVINPASKKEVASCRAWINTVIALIASADEGMAAEIEQYVSHIKIFTGRGAVGISDVRIIGAMFVRLPEADHDPHAYFTEHIVHETSHMHLHAMMAHDPMLLNDMKELYQAPIRLDPRPMFGIFHATFVLSRIVRVFRRICSHNDSPHFLKTLRGVERQYARGYETVIQHARPTTIGQQVIQSLPSVL